MLINNNNRNIIIAMKHILFILLFFLPSFGFTQQFLWSTAKTDRLKDSDTKAVPISTVSEKLLDYYEFYDYYYDLSGFSRAGFEDFLTKDSKAAKLIQWDSLMAFDETVAFAFKGNEGRGSIVAVMLVQKENIDLILFSNETGRSATRSHSTEVDKFAKWLSSFWDYGNKNRVSNGNSFSDSTNITEYGLANRRYVVRPNIVDDGAHSGNVAVEINVDRQGKVVFARAGVRGTTIADPELNLQCEHALLEAKFNAVKDGPEIQRGTVFFKFKPK